MYYLRSRFYNPDKCRFISCDSIVDVGSQFISCNLYCYCKNNCVNRIDPQGNIDCYVWKENTVLKDWNGNFITPLVLGTKLQLSAYGPNEFQVIYNSSRGEIHGRVNSNAIIIWYGDDAASLAKYKAEYFHNFTDKEGQPIFYQQGNSHALANAAINVLLNRYDETHDNGKHQSVDICGDYNLSTYYAVELAQKQLCATVDNKFGDETFTKIAEFLSDGYEYSRKHGYLE